MKRIAFITIMCWGAMSFAQGKDKQLIGDWQLFEIIDNLTGLTVPITHKSSDSAIYKIQFEESKVRYNMEINKCENEYFVSKDGTIEFKYFSACSEFCCDGDFSTLLTYDEATKYYIKEGRTLILVSEDRIFYFKKSD